MIGRKILLLAAIGVSMCGGLWAQATAGSISGIVQDPQGAVVAGAKMTLTNEAQGAASARQVATGPEGTYVFSPVLPGQYTVDVEAAGFKKFTQTHILLNVNDRLGLPSISLEVGTTGETVNVEATAVQLETVTAERSGLVTGRQMVDIALNGRNYTGLLKTVPGVPADATGGDATFNGGRTGQNNYTVDGQNVTDIGVNQQFAYRINVDAIAEFKVSTNAQSAEFGRNDGAQVQIVTRSGTRDFHGDGYWFKRGEFMNANNFLNNAQPNMRDPNTGKLVPAFPQYRFMTAGYTVGGPAYIPGKFNRNKDKLFFFMSHEWNRSFTPNALRQITVPTAAERQGDFSNTRDAAGVRQTIYDPLTRSAANPKGTPFTGNQVPKDRFNQYGPSVLNWLPLPNVTGQPNYNYQSQAANSSPSFDQVYRADYNISEKWRLFVRGLNSKQTQTVPYGRADTGNNLGLSPLTAPTYGWSITANVATIITPTLTNEFQFGYTVNGIPGDPPPVGSPYYRSVSQIDIPLLYPAANVSGVIPNFVFDGTPTVSGTAMTSFAGTPYNNRNPVWNYIDNVSKIIGTHALKAGIYYERAIKTENAFKPYNGTINFGRDPNNPGDTNWAFSNALLGNYQTYTQINQDPLPSYPYTNFEFYGQDSWKVTKRLTVNYGLRVAFVAPFHDTLGMMSNFDNSKYNPANQVVFFQPVNSAGTRQALNPITGQILPAPYIGAMVPGVGDINNGMVRSGQNGTPLGLIQHRGPQFGPRFGVAYQIDDKTVFRAGGGAFYERIATFGVGITSNYTTNPPLLRTATIYYGNLSNIQSAGGVFFPTGVNQLAPDGHVPTVYNYNAGLQRELPSHFFLDVSYVGSQSRHLWLAQPFNFAPFGSAWQAYSQDPTKVPKFDGTTNLPTDMYRPYAGYSNGTSFTWGTSANYNALQVALNRRVGRLQLGGAYTWSKALGVSTAPPGQPGNPINIRASNYGPLPQNRTQSLAINYIYDLPSLARKGSFLDNGAGRLVFDGWQLSGLTSMSTGAPINVTYSVSGVSGPILNATTTGSPDLAPRVIFTCNPNLSRGDRDINAFINTSCFAPAPKGSLAMDSGFDRITGPGINQWDMSLFKSVSIRERARIQLRLEAYNAFNHTEWGPSGGPNVGVNNTIVFSQAGKVINLPTQLGGTGGRLGFGALNGIRPNSQRILQIAAKVYF
jgi:Carboxypeptidase regulatory-like domain/TonB-dependent Receptor Plug Domain